jgi:uncharacterized protein with von Willebrand factor type A (vWA) domain
MLGENIHRDVVGLARSLRAAGLPVGIDQTASFARALGFVDPLSKHEVRLAARATLTFRREDQPVFDALFEAFWSGDAAAAAVPQKVPRAPRHDPATFHRTALVSYMAQRAGERDPEVPVPERAKAASAVELLQRKDFSELTAAELAAIERALRDLRFDVIRRTTRRRVAARRGDQLDLRGVLRAAARRGGQVLVLPRRRRKVKRRPLVVLADVSGSMELYSRLLLQFLHGMTQGLGETETFVFGTRLTRITAELRLRNVDVALDRAAHQIVDFAGGTRIGQNVGTFNRVHGRRVLRRGAVVLLVSDGWETGDATLLDTELGRLKRRCHRLVWLNPLLGGPAYQPEAKGMAAALAHIDDFLPVHNLQSLRDLSFYLARIPARKGPLSKNGAAVRGQPRSLTVGGLKRRRASLGGLGGIA